MNNNINLKDEEKDLTIPVDEALDQQDVEQITRYYSPELDKMLGIKMKILDEGFIRIIDYMGGDNSITQAARISYGNGTKSVSQDTALIDFLLRHRHTSPFEMCEIKLHIRAPIFIARQWLRHRTANVNELSARYSVIKKGFYIPDEDEIKQQCQNNKQSKGEKIEGTNPQSIVDQIKSTCNSSFDNYNQLIDKGLARELCRSVLPQNTYTEFYWKIDLHNLLHFLSLRTKEGAQYEIREYANIILNKIVKIWTPMVYSAFVNHRMESVTFSGKSMEQIKHLMDKDKVERFINDNPKPRGENRELIEALNRLLA